MIKWTDSLLTESLAKICRELGYFPSAAEMRQQGRNDLVCAMTKRGGIDRWTKAVGYERQTSDSDYGWFGEKMAADLLRAVGFKVEMREGVKWPHDLTVDGVLRVDVKSAEHASYGKGNGGWHYRLGKCPQADLILLLQTDTKAFYALPWYVCPTGNITISPGGGKYAKYLNNWQVVRSMVSMRTIEHAMETGKIQEVA